MERTQKMLLPSSFGVPRIGFRLGAMHQRCQLHRFRPKIQWTLLRSRLEFHNTGPLFHARSAT